MKLARVIILFKNKMKEIFFTLVIVCFLNTDGIAQQEIPLFSGKVPNSKLFTIIEKNVGDIVSGVSSPTLSVFLPPAEKATRTAVIICPGGGYGVLVANREGFAVAKAFNKMGVTAFVLKYRLPDNRIMKDKSIGPLQDAQQAIKIIRQRANEWGIDPKKVGIMGFSAGGHLAATAGTHFNHPVIENQDAVNLRPDFMILGYPVISMTDSLGHAGSRNNLLGPEPSDNQIKYFSNELQVNETTPPAFITHAGDDSVVPVANSIAFFNAMKQNGVSGELHIYAKGGHGYSHYPLFDEWFGRCLHWMKNMDLIL